MNQPVRVLHMTSAYGGGIYSFIKSKLYTVDFLKIKMDMVAFEEAPAHVREDMEKHGGSIYCLPNPKTEGFSAFYKSFKNILYNGKYDVIHCHFIGYHAFLFYLIARKKMDRFIIHAHSAGVTEVKQNKVRAKCIERINQFLNRIMPVELASCGTVASKYAYGKKTMQKRKITFLPNSINPDDFYEKTFADQRQKLKEANGIPNDKKIIGQIGRLEPNKNQIFTLELAEIMKDKNDSYYWLFIGEGRDRKRIEDKIKELNLSSQVKLLGRREDIGSFYSVLDGMIFPSLTEGFGITAIEAQTSGVPSLISDSISKEVDLELDLLQFISLNEKNRWIEALESIKRKPELSKEQIYHSLKRKQYTNKDSAKKYEEFILNLNGK